MTEKETEGLALLQHYAVDPHGRVILTKLAESIQVANAFQRTQWVPTARPSKGWTVNLRTGQIFALTLRRDEVQILLLPEMLGDEERKALEETSRDKFEPEHPPGSARYTLELIAARKLWGSVERAHHAALQQRRHRSGARNNPEAGALIDYLSRELKLDLPYPDPELMGANGKAHPPSASLLDAYAASDAGKAILRALASSIAVANEVGRGHWGTTVEKDGAYVALNIGNACAIRLHPDKVRILLFPDRLDAATREALEAKTSHSWDRPAIRGSRNYELDWSSAARMWGPLESAHHSVLIAEPRRRTTFYKSHSNVVIDFLNRTLKLQLPYPDYGADADRTPAARHSVATDGASGVDSGFQALIRSVETKGLHFPTETLANYILALQTKRFAILSGISGTGKTQIAMAVARCFRATVQDRDEAEPDEALTTDDSTRMTARPFHFKFRQIILPVAFVAKVDHVLIAEPNSNGGPIMVAYPGGLAKLRFWRDPNPAKNVTWLLFGGARDFRNWYMSNLQPGDHFFLGLREGERPREHRIEFRLAETEVTERELDNGVVVPVRPDWVDNRGLLGYLNPLTNEYVTTPFLSLLLDARTEVARAKKEGREPHPFFVVLDEMNLARVEHYFSDFLSALESDEPIPLHESEEVEEGGTESGAVVPRKLRVPSNVFFTGTVNVDETTYMFSPKVLDRAFTIEFDRVDLDGYTTGTGSDEAEGLNLDRGDGPLRLTPYEKPGRKDWVSFSKLEGGRFHRTLLKLHRILEEEHRHFGYRVANEIAGFVNLAHEQSTDPRAAEHAFDLALLQKVLPKFHGTQQELEPILRRLASALGATLSDSSEDVPAGTSAAGPEPRTEGRAPRFPRTGAKIQRMLRRLKQRGFTSFIE